MRERGVMAVIRNLLFVMSILLSIDVAANHVMGGNISYTCLGADTYGITLTVYTDCFGGTPPIAQENVFFIPQNNCTLPFSVNLQYQTTEDITDLCASEIVNSSCNGGVNPGMETQTYYAEVTLDPGCVWDISWNGGDWNYFINMDNGLLPTAYILTTLDPTVVGCADSVLPVNTFPVNYACANEAVTYPINISNPNGYDLTFSLVCPFTVGGADAPLTAPCNEPIPGMTIDPTTGEISFTNPALFGNYVANVEIVMEDNGNYVGTVNQAVGFIAQSCITTPTIFTTPELTTVGDDVTTTGPNALEVCAGDSVIFTVEATNVNIIRAITLTSDVTTEFPGADFIVNGLNPAVATVEILTDATMVGTTTVTFDAIDDACANPGTDQITVDITVLPGVNIDVADTTICFGESVDFNAFGDTDFQWNVLSGDPAPGIVGNDPSQTLTPDQTTQIELISLNAGAGCNADSTFTITVALSDITAVLSDETCNENDGEIDVTTNGAIGNISYDWPGIPSTMEDQTGLTGGTYNLTVTDDGVLNCSVDTMFTLTSDPPPSGFISGDATICENACTDITFDLTGTGPFTVQLLNEQTGLLEAVPAISDGGTFQVCPTVTTTYTLQSIQDSNTPQCTYTTPSSVTITVRPIPTATFIAVPAICAGASAALEVDIDQPGNFNVTYNPAGNPASPVTITDGGVVTVFPATTTDYTITNIEYTDAPLCPNTTVQSTQVQVDPLPTITAPTTDFTICNGDPLSIDFTFAGTGPWEFTHNYPGEASPVTANTANFTWVLGTPPTTNTTITVDTEVLDTGTNCTSTDATDIAINVTVNALPVAAVLSDQTICATETATLEFDLVGAGPFDVEWNDGVATSNEVDIADGFQVQVNPTGNVDVCINEVVDNNGCISTTQVCAALTETPQATGNFSVATDEICSNACYDITFTFASGTGPYEVTLDETDDNGVVTNVVVLNDGDVYNVCPTGNYSAVITGIVDQGTNCNVDFAAQSTFDLTVTPISTVDLSGSTTICNQECTDLIFTFTDEQGPLTLELDGVVIGVLDPALDLVGGQFLYEVCPIATTTYTLTAYTDGSTVCSAIGTSQATVTVNPLPDASFVSDQVICEGETANLEFDVTNGPVNLEVSIDDGNAVTTETLNGIATGDTYDVTPALTTTYTITNVSDGGMPECTATPNTVGLVTVNTAPIIEVVDTLCANTAEFYQLVVNITSGDPNTYAVDVPGNIVQLDATTWQYTSDQQSPPETPVDFTFSDGNACDDTTLVGQGLTCPILTFSGTVDLTTQGFCDSGTLTTTFNNDEVLDPNDVLSFIIHSSATDQLGVVYYISDQPTWDIAADLDLVGTLSYGTVYYLSAVAGDDDGSGIVDLGAPGISVSEGTPFTIVETPTATLSGNATICAGQTTNLQVDFTGTGDYTVQWALDGVEPAASPTGPIADNPLLIPVGDDGTYTLLDVSNEFCSGTINGTADVIVNPLPTADLTGGGTFCEGGSLDLTLDLTGTANWDVTIANDNNGDGTVDFTETINIDVANSLYTVSDSLQWYVDAVTDGNGCVNDMDTAPVVVEIDPLPTATIAFGDTSFCAGTTFDLDVALTGTGPWEVIYSIDGVQTTVNVAASPMLETISQPGLICIDQVTDDNGCVSNPAACITATEIALPLADAGPNVAYCTGSSIQIGTADNPAYTYEWDNAADLDDATVAQPNVVAENTSGLPETTTYSVTVSEAFCESQSQVDVTVNPLPIPEAGDSTFICFGDPLVLNASGGVTYLWEDNGAFTLGGLDTPNPTVEPFQSDWFVVTVTDANTCSDQDSIWVNVPLELTAAIDGNGPLCFQQCDGELAMIPSGGWVPYTYEWVEPGVTDSLATGLCAGVYTYELTDSIGCVHTGNSELLELPEYFLDDVLLTQPTCFGDSTGIIDVESAAALNFTLVDPEATNNLGIFSGLPEGNYDVLATDANGCIADSTVSLVFQSPEIDMTVAFDEIPGCVGDEVNFLAEATGGDGNFVYQWYASEPPADPINNTSFFDTTIVETVNFSVVALDGFGCSSDTLTSSVILSDSIFVNAGPLSQIEICQGECLELTSEATGGGAPLQIDWAEITFTGDTVGTLNDIEVCPPIVNEISYVVYASDGCAATASDTVEVFLFDIPVVEFAVDTTSGCFPLTVQFSNLTDPSFLELCEWQFGDNVTQGICEDIEYTYALPGEYFPILNVTALSGCSFADTLDTPIVVHGYPTADFFWEPEPVTTLENEVQFFNDSFGGVTFEWDFGNGEASIDENPSIILPPVELDFYEVCLAIENEFGCADTTCKELLVQSELLIYVPNSFTPDQDGINEVFVPVIGGGIAAQDYLFRIWDRWGEIIFESTEPGQGWTGNVKNGGYYTMNDVYIWDLTVRDITTGELRNLKGDVTILR